MNNSQTHFGFTNIGSDIVIAIWNSNFWFGVTLYHNIGYWFFLHLNNFRLKSKDASKHQILCTKSHDEETLEKLLPTLDEMKSHKFAFVHWVKKLESLENPGNWLCKICTIILFMLYKIFVVLLLYCIQLLLMVKNWKLTSREDDFQNRNIRIE